MWRLFGLALVSAALLGCSPSLPEDSKIESLVREKALSEGFDDLFGFEAFVKTNGFRESENVYIVDVEYDLVFRKSFIDVVREIRQDPTDQRYGPLGSRFLLAAIQSNFGQFEVGDKLHKREKLRLHNTEQGWLLAE